MNTKMLVGGLIGFVTLFLLGWLIYGTLMAGTLAQYANAACAKPMEEMNMQLMVVGNLAWGMALSYLLSNWSGQMSAVKGAAAAAVFGLLIAIAYGCMMYATTNNYTSMTYVAIDSVLSAVMYGVAGGAIGWWLGRK